MIRKRTYGKLKTIMLPNKKSSPLLLFVGGVLLLAGLFLMFDRNIKALVQIKKKASPTVPIEDERKKLKEIREFVKNKGQIIIFTAQLGDKFDLANTIGYDCVSCHTRWIYVFDKNNTLVFETMHYDGLLGYADSESFIITQHENMVIKDGSFHARLKIRVFRWNGETFVEKINKE